MIDRCANHRQTQRDIHPRQRLPNPGNGIDVEAEQLDRDVALVVVHGDDGVVMPRPQLYEDGVAGDGPLDVHALGAALRDDGGANVDILAAEQPPFPGMRVQRGDGNARFFDAEIQHRPVGDVDGAAETFRGQEFRHVLQRNMGGDMGDPHIAVRQQHIAGCGVRQIGQHVGMPGVFIPGEIQRFLVQRRGDDAVDAALLRQCDSPLHRHVGEAAAFGIDLTEADRAAFLGGGEHSQCR